MELATLKVPRQKAREAFMEYREAVRDHRHPSHEAEDEAMMRAYRALAKGERVLVLSQALAAAGTELVAVPRTVWRSRGEGGSYQTQVDVEVPKLAVARADTTRVWCNGIRSDGSVRMTTRSELELHHANRRDVFERSGVFPARERSMGDRSVVAIVPTIPPKLRPKRTQLRNFHVLFEAEWALDPEPPVDPALLRHLGGDLYAVVAVWNLTEVERAVLAITR